MAVVYTTLEYEFFIVAHLASLSKGGGAFFFHLLNTQTMWQDPHTSRNPTTPEPDFWLWIFLIFVLPFLIGGML